jgi:D-arabinose 1-dehydrogenase-like Zn-dependent alcohol dehydrogenase
VINGQVRIHGVVVGNRDDLEALSRFLTAHTHLKPVIDSAYAPLEAAPAAFAAMQRGPLGKVVVHTSAFASRL